ncbi:MAG TPA: hypothetical protein VEF34_14045 [Syntrophobacteraceae bacterium]|nr:hypothetical protein [Syntrophobacteraceae bacterium]
MQDVWFSDNRDLVKWSVLFRLAEQYHCRNILQIAYYRYRSWGTIQIDGRQVDLPKEVTDFFRNIRRVQEIQSTYKVIVFCGDFQGRNNYLNDTISFIHSFSEERCIVFLDPDTGLEPSSPNFKHVLDSEAKAIFDAMKRDDVFVFYQHQTNRSGQPWIEPKRQQLIHALGVQAGDVKIAQGEKIARDVVFYFLQRV